MYRRFVPDDYLWYADWYQDDILKDSLGPLDEAWLACRIHDPASPAYVVMDQGDTVGVIGCTLDDGTHGFDVLTELAIHPALRRRKYGGGILADLIAGRGPLRGGALRAYVCRCNVPAIAFFTQLATRVQGESDDMIAFIITDDASPRSSSP